jgi:hypothetical protein
MHSLCNALLSLHEPIHSLPLHLHVHLALEEKPLEMQDLGLELSLPKKSSEKIQHVECKHDEDITPHHLFEMMKVLHIKTLLATQRRQ